MEATEEEFKMEAEEELWPGMSTGQRWESMHGWAAANTDQPLRLQ